MNLSRREIGRKEKRDVDRENDNSKDREGVIKRTLKSGEKLLVAGVLATGLAIGGCGSAKTGEQDTGTDRTGGRLEGIQDTATESDISDVIDEDAVSDVPMDGMDVADDDVIGDTVSDTEDATGDVLEDSDEDTATDVEEDTSADVELDSDLDASDVIDEDISGDLVDDSEDAVSDTSTDGTSDIIGDTIDESDMTEDVISDMEDEDISLDGSGDIVSDGTTDTVSEDAMEEDVVDEDLTLVCRPYDDTVTDAWIATGTASLVGGVYIMYTGMDHSGNGLYDIICGGTIVRSDVPVALGTTVTVDVLEMGFRAEIEANSLSSIGTHSDITIALLSSAICSATDATRTVTIHVGVTTNLGGIGVRYDGPTTSGEGTYSILCDGGSTVVRSGITVAVGDTHTEYVPEQYFSVTFAPTSATSTLSRVDLDVDG